MNVVILTAGRPHHAYIARQVHQRFPLKAIFLETERLEPPFAVDHPFEAAREAHEREVLGDADPPLEELTETQSFTSLNEPAAVAALRKIAPDVVLVIGTGLLRLPIIQAASRACLNLHGGQAEVYRGLDSHLWAIYHDDFKNIVTTLHHVDAELDTGDIVLQERLKLRPGMELHELRALNAEACARLALLALTSLAEFDWLPARPQIARGRYYSFMPADLKDVCVKKFTRHVRALSRLGSKAGVRAKAR